MSSAKNAVTNALAEADIRIGGNRPWDLRVSDERFYEQVLKFQNLGLGEAFMDGWVECDRWDEFATRVLAVGVANRLPIHPRLLLFYGQSVLLNLGSKRRSRVVGKRHYDVGNDLFEKMLDRRMVYSCGYWKNATNLDEAEEAKLDLICRKIGLEPGMRVLDIGSGWGSFVKFATERYGANAVGITISKEQAEYAKRAASGLPVDIRLQDYRDLKGEKFDRIVSVGMIEHVGYKNYGSFMAIVERLLADDGLFLLHTIGARRSVRANDPWINKYIFPNSMLPSMAQLARAFDGRFIAEDWHNFGADYDKTLLAWYENFTRAWPELSAKYDERFRRMWTYYLLTCAGTFRSRMNQVWQIVLSRRGVPGGYESVR